MRREQRDVLERATAVMQEAIADVWQAIWNRADISLAICERVGWDKELLDRMMDPLARSHQDVIRWAEFARYWPADERRQDRSPQWHQQEMRRRLRGQQ